MMVNFMKTGSEVRKFCAVIWNCSGDVDNIIIITTIIKVKGVLGTSKNFPSLQHPDRLWTRPDSCTTGTGAIALEESSRGVKLRV
jgi:hypothetical protein